MTICGESGHVSGDTVTSWKEHLPESSQATQKQIFGILMKLAAFGRLCLQKDLDRKLSSVKVARNLSCKS